MPATAKGISSNPRTICCNLKTRSRGRPLSRTERQSPCAVRAEHDSKQVPHRNRGRRQDRARSRISKNQALEFYEEDLIRSARNCRCLMICSAYRAPPLFVSRLKRKIELRKKSAARKGNVGRVSIAPSLTR